MKNEILKADIVISGYLQIQIGSYIEAEECRQFIKLSLTFLCLFIFSKYQYFGSVVLHPLFQFLFINLASDLYYFSHLLPSGLTCCSHPKEFIKSECALQLRCKHRHVSCSRNHLCSISEVPISFFFFYLSLVIFKFPP